MPAAALPFPKPVKHPGDYENKKSVAGQPPKTMTIYSPEGEKVELPTANARDYVRSKGYSLFPKGTPVGREESVTVGAKIGGSTKVSFPEKPESNPNLDALNDLRKKAEALGITVDNRWGIRRLNEEIAEKSDKGA